MGLIHCRIDNNELNSQAEMRCGIKGIQNMPIGDTYFFIGERPHRISCLGCNPNYKAPLPAKELSGKPGHPGYDEFVRIAKSWGYD